MLVSSIERGWGWQKSKDLDKPLGSLWRASLLGCELISPISLRDVSGERFWATPKPLQYELSRCLLSSPAPLSVLVVSFEKGDGTKQTSVKKVLFAEREGCIQYY